MPALSSHAALLVLILALCVCAFPAGAQPRAPQVAVPFTAAPPEVNGRVDDSWADATSLAAFGGFPSGQPTPVQPQVWLVRDAEALYVGARLPLARGERPVARAAQRDGAVWADDALELFLAPQAEEPVYYHFIANAAGCRYDARGQDASWNTDWTAVTTEETGAWSLTLRIPFAALGATPGEGAWGLNVAWDRQGTAPKIASWARVERTFHEPANFGRAWFPQDAPAIQIVGPTQPEAGTIAFTGTWRSNAPLQAGLKVERLEGTVAVEVASQSASLDAGDAQPFRLSAELPARDAQDAAARYRVALTITRAGQPVYAVGAPLTISLPLELKVRSYPVAGNIRAEVDASALQGLAENTPVALAVTTPDGRELQSASVLVSPGRPQGTLVFDTGGLAPGKYRVAAGAPGLAAPTTAGFTKPERPAWLGSREGITDRVLAPWTPVQVGGDRVQVWGREYRFGSLPFPSEVTTAGASILAGPITLEVVADGATCVWPATGEMRVAKALPESASLEATAGTPGVVCQGRVTTEFDGMVRSDFSLRPAAANTFERVALVIPLKEQHAKYLCFFPGSWGTARNAGALPPEGFTSPFKPLIWLGDEDRGFTWFTESDRGFSLDDPDQAIRIERRDGVVTLRVNIITKPVPAEDRDFTFGFQATPVKPLDPDVWDYRICHHGNYGIEDQPWQTGPVLSYPAEGAVQLAQGTIEAWVRPTFNQNPDVKPDDPGRGRFNRNLFEVRCSDESRLGLYWNVDDRGMRVYFRQGPSRHTLVFGAPVLWQPGEWHHVAFTWGPETVIYLDGKRAASQPFQGSITANLSGATIAVGDQPSEFDVDELRISDIPRTEFDLAGPPVADEHTLLLDHLDAAPGGDGPRTSPESGEPAVAVGGRSVAGRFGAAYELVGGTKMTLLDRLAELGVRTICFHEHWTDIQNYTSTTHGEALHKLVQACHARGIRLLLYFGYLMADNAPEWGAYSDEVLVAPRTGDYHREPDQMCYSVCYNSAWQDFLADGIARVMDEYDVDGVYLDGTEYPWACSNTHHGCGYVRPDGTVAPTTTLFATRDLMKRIYTIVKSRKPDGEVNVHNSTCMTIPTLAWATSSWDGEQFGSIDRGPNALDVLPLDSFRAEFMGRQWGVPAEFLCYNRPYTYSEAMSFTLLHDVLVRGGLGGGLEMEAKLWAGMDAFGRKQARWLPYWSNAAFVTTGPDDSVKASVYSRDALGAVVVVSNLGEADRDVQVRLSRERLQLPARVQATDMLTGDPIPIDDDGQMSFPLTSFGFRVVWVKP